MQGIWQGTLTIDPAETLADTFIARSPAIAARVMDGEMMIMSAVDSTFFSLNEVATVIFQAADGLTPLPKDVMPLMVKAWAYNPQGQFVKGPEYAIKLLGPAPKEGADRPVLKTQMFGPPPVTFRAEATDKTPTVEVKLP